MRATMRNSRSGYAKHNDRDFDINSPDNDGHIDADRQYLNTYWHCYGEEKLTFAQAEKKYYEEHYKASLEESNRIKINRRHKELCRTMKNVLESKKSAPEETILQIGDRNETVDLRVFEACVKEYVKELEKFSSNIHILDYAIHADEETPHAHIRKVYDYVDEKGHECLSQVQALKALGFDCPDPEQKVDRLNNPKVSFDAYMREKWYDICLEHDIEIERDPRDNSQGHRDKEQFIADQKLEEEKSLQKSLEESQRHAMELAAEIERLKKENRAQNKLIQKQEMQLQNKDKELEETKSQLEQAMDAYEQEAGHRKAKRLARENRIDKGLLPHSSKEKTKI